MKEISFFLLTGILLSAACCLVVPRLLARKGFLDVPGERSSHARPTPKGGGVGFVLGFIGVAAYSGLPMLLWLPLAVLSGLSFVNDLYGISPKMRLVAQFVTAAATLFGAWWSGYVTWNGALLLPAILFVVATSNCFNFMDGINGIAGISGAVAFICFMLFGVMGEIEPPLLLPSVAMVGGLVGFLPFNLPRARLFMGDVGSISLGFLYAVLVCIMAGSWTEFFVLASFLYPFYMDEAVTMAERVWRGEPLMEPHRRHLYQFLANELGIEHWKISVAYGALQLAIASLAVVAGRFGLVAVLSMNASLLAIWAATHWTLKRRFLSRNQGL